MSRYSEISKRVGWQSAELDIPTMATVKALHKNIVEHQSEESFVEIVKVWRFGKLPQTIEECDTMQELTQAYKDGRTIFESIEIPS